MRRLNLQMLRNMSLDNAPRPPAPFPGKFPTWIAFGGDAQQWEYVGKPSGNAIQLLTKQITRGPRGSRVHIYEFDRKGVIAYAAYISPNRLPGALVPSWMHMQLYEYYHPFEETSFIIPHFQRKFYVKRLKANGVIHRVYSPFERLKVATHIEPFRTRLRGMGI